MVFFVPLGVSRRHPGCPAHNGPLSGHELQALILYVAEQYHGGLVTATRSLVSLRAPPASSPPVEQHRSARDAQVTPAGRIPYLRYYR